LTECTSRRHKLSGYLNAVFLIFFLWYFFIHVGLDRYYHNYISSKETFLDDVYYTAKVASYTELNARLPRTKAYDIFIGDSLIEQFPIGELLPDQSILNRGIGQDTTAGVLKRLENNINNVRIDKLFLLIGHNDLQYRSVEEVSNNIKKIMKSARARKKYFLSILPCADATLHDAIVRINKSVKDASRENDFIYLDCYNHFLAPDGRLSTRYYYDGTHLNVAGYVQLKECIELTTDM
jgi:lysophospholipase L1-like esterase